MMIKSKCVNKKQKQNEDKENINPEETMAKSQSKVQKHVMLKTRSHLGAQLLRAWVFVEVLSYLEPLE